MNDLRANMVRADADFSATVFKAKIADAELLWRRARTSMGRRTAPTPSRLSVRPHHGGLQGAELKAEVVANILAAGCVGQRDFRAASQK